MKICLLSNRDIGSAYALAHLLPQLREHDITIFLSARVGKKSSAAAQDLQDLSAFDASLIEDSASRFNFSRFEALTQNKIELLSSIKTDEGLERLSRIQADLFISIRFGHILHDAAIALPRLGVLNLHSGILPDYKGVMASFWAMKHGEKSIGTTLHFIEDSQIDSGAILEFRKRSVDYQRSYLWNVLQLYPEGCESIVTAVTRLQEGKALPQIAQKTEGNYFSFPNDEDLQGFREQGNSLFNKKEILELLQSKRE